MFTLLENFFSKHACLHYWRKTNQSMHAYTAGKKLKAYMLTLLPKKIKAYMLTLMKQTSKHTCLHCWKKTYAYMVGKEMTKKKELLICTHTQPHIHQTHKKAYWRKQHTKFVLTHLSHNCLCLFLHFVTLILLLLDLVVARGAGLHGIGPDHQLTSVRVKVTWGGHWHKVCHQGFVTWGGENAAWNGCQHKVHHYGLTNPNRNSQGHNICPCDLVPAVGRMLHEVAVERALSLSSSVLVTTEPRPPWMLF